MMIKKLFYSNYEDGRHLGLLIVRVGIGLAFMAHGYPKLFMGGVGHLAHGLTAAGIPGGIFAAYLSAMAEFFGGIALILGIAFRPVTFIMAFNMVVAVLYHLLKGQGFGEYSHALEDAVVFISLILIGPGKFCLDELFFGISEKSSKHGAMELETKSV